jgi:HTH-type transcriptional regulator / antitoxin HigA
MSNTRQKHAEAFPPAEFIKDELEARGWSQGTFAKILGRPLQAVNMIINGKKAITAQTAAEIGAAFGTSATFWMNVETAWQLSRVKPVAPGIARRASKAAVASASRGG